MSDHLPRVSRGSSGFEVYLYWSLGRLTGHGGVEGVRVSMGLRNFMLRIITESWSVRTGEVRSGFASRIVPHRDQSVSTRELMVTRDPAVPKGRFVLSVDHS